MANVREPTQQSGIERLVFYSRLAFYPIHWETLKYICTHYRVQGTVIANIPPDLPLVHQQHGWINPKVTAQDRFSPDVSRMPTDDRVTQARWLCRELRAIRPNAIWVQEEPTDYFLFHILKTYFFDRRPRIVTAVCENIFPRRSLPIRMVQRLLWGRLDGLLAVAKPSIEGVRAAGMPSRVPAMSLVAGALPPPAEVGPMPLPFSRTEKDFLIGFAGRICEEKGWKVLLSAMLSLPESFKCLIAGNGPQASELGSWLERPELRRRAFYVGLLSKEALWSFYRSLDCFVVPSLTFPEWKEQFGGVLADGMAMGLPLVGSDSGAIPEVVGSAGLIVPEGKPDTLASAILRLWKDPEMRRQKGKAGQQRFWAEFAIPAYASKIARGLRLIER